MKAPSYDGILAFSTREPGTRPRQAFSKTRSRLGANVHRPRSWAREAPDRVAGRRSEESSPPNFCPIVRRPFSRARPSQVPHARLPLYLTPERPSPPEPWPLARKAAKGGRGGRTRKNFQRFTLRPSLPPIASRGESPPRFPSQLQRTSRAFFLRGAGDLTAETGAKLSHQSWRAGEGLPWNSGPRRKRRRVAPRCLWTACFVPDARRLWFVLASDGSVGLVSGSETLCDRRLASSFCLASLLYDTSSFSSVGSRTK
jgi:hypothetical protein